VGEMAHDKRDKIKQDLDQLINIPGITKRLGSCRLQRRHRYVGKQAFKKRLVCIKVAGPEF